MMISVSLKRIFEQSAPKALFLRAGIVGLNFVVMVCIAAYLGFSEFGRLAFLWGGALMASTVLSLGGPLILLKRLTDGGGLRTWDLFGYCILYPLLVAVSVLGPLTWALPLVAWEAVLFGGVAINLVFCLASVMRALGSVQMSMALRDAGPQIALGSAVFVVGHQGAALTLFASACLMCGLGVIGVIWCVRQSNSQTLIAQTSGRVWSASLYGTSFLGMALSQMDLVIGGAILHGEAFGLYALLRRVANLVALPVTVATWVSARKISSAFGKHDLGGVRRASAEGSRIALYPGVLLFAVGICGLPFLALVTSTELVLPGMTVFALLLGGALSQVIFASSYTVATLCGLAHLSVLARACVIVFYVVATQVIGDELTIVRNAFAYTAAIVFGGCVLWWHVKRALGIDTSAFVMAQKKEDRWLTP